MIQEWTQSLAAQQIDTYLMKILTARGYGSTMTTSAQREVARDIREKLCYVAEDFDAELQRAQAGNELDKNYQLPDGQVITLGDERFRCPEVLFKPGLIGLEQDGIHLQAARSIGESPPELQSGLWGNVTLDGVGAGLPGLAARLQAELAALAPAGTLVSVRTNPAG